MTQPESPLYPRDWRAPLIHRIRTYAVDHPDDAEGALAVAKEAFAELGATPTELEGVQLMESEQGTRVKFPSALTRRLDQPYLPVGVTHADLEAAAEAGVTVGAALFSELGASVPPWSELEPETQEGWIDTAYEVAATGTALKLEEPRGPGALEVAWQAADLVFIVTVTAKVAMAAERAPAKPLLEPEGLSEEPTP